VLARRTTRVTRSRASQVYHELKQNHYMPEADKWESKWEVCCDTTRMVVA
jgi:hypothetical protein